MSEKRQPIARITSALRAASVRRVLAPAAGDAEVERVPRRERALAHERRVDGDVDVLGERLRARSRRVGADHAAAREDQRPLRLQQHLERAARPPRASRASASSSICERSSGSGHLDVGRADPEVVRARRCARGPGRPVRASLNAFGRNFAEVLDDLRLEAPLRDHLGDRSGSRPGSGGTPPGARPSRTGSSPPGR